MKLRKLHIEDYKMFKDFDISFVDENDKALPIVVLAGVNGSGKTTLLEFINNAFDILSSFKFKKSNLFVEFDNYIILNREKIGEIKKNEIENKKSRKQQYEKNPIEPRITATLLEDTESYYVDNMIYLSTGEDKIENIKEIIIQKYIDRAFEIDKPSEALRELQDYIKDIFDGLDLTFNLSSIDYNKKEVLFKDNNGVEFDIDKLSTGEKTLLSKVLYLYFKGYKDKVILIDEPELSLHPKWQNKILKIYENFATNKENNCQIIIATHSPHIIGSAKNEYIRFLEKDEEGHVRAINDIQAYGRDIEWVLEQMGVADTRLPKITKRFEEIQELINNEEFDKADDALDKLEYVIGENDKGILALRNDLAFERMDFEEDN